MVKLPQCEYLDCLTGIRFAKTCDSIQTGPFGWNLNLGPTAAVHDIARCASGGVECLDAVTTTLFTPLVYTDDVEEIRTSSHKNDTYASATGFLLPQLPNYFPANDPLGMCTKVTLSMPTTSSRLLRRDDVATVGGDGITTWPGCETLTDVVARRDLVARQSGTSTTTQLPICNSNNALRTTTVTATVSVPERTTAPEPQVASGGKNRRKEHSWLVYAIPLVMLHG